MDGVGRYCHWPTHVRCSILHHSCSGTDRKSSALPRHLLVGCCEKAVDCIVRPVFVVHADSSGVHDQVRPGNVTPIFLGINSVELAPAYLATADSAGSGDGFAAVLRTLLPFTSARPYRRVFENSSRGNHDRRVGSQFRSVDGRVVFSRFSLSRCCASLWHDGRDPRDVVLVWLYPCSPIGIRLGASLNHLRCRFSPYNCSGHTSIRRC